MRAELLNLWPKVECQLYQLCDQLHVLHYGERDNDVRLELSVSLERNVLVPERAAVCKPVHQLVLR